MRLKFSLPFTAFLGLLVVILIGRPALAQDHENGEPQQNPQQSATTPDESGENPHGGPSMAGMNMPAMTPAGMDLMNLSSGTSVNPASWPMPMVTVPFGSWNTMFMGQAFMVDTQQSGPRGGDKLYSTNWFMAAAEHRVGNKGAFQVDLMLSLEPATVTGERYPLLFQTGETAYGKPLVDAQHPHNFIMGLGFHYAYQLTKNTIVDAYFAPVGDPALGPVAFPHRASAMELPEAPLSHHLQDSTHISDEVLTAGISHKKVRLEASGFYGSEPGENRWIIQAGPINSWSTRLWFFPTNNWTAQVSVGRLAHPEALEPGDQVRETASLEYSKPLRSGSWTSSLIWGRKHNTANFHNLNSYLVESVFPVTPKNLITGRAELVDKDDLFSDQPDVEQRLDALYGSTFRIGAYTIGYTRDIHLFPFVETGIGVNFSAYTLPGSIKPYYGDHPVGGDIFIRFRLRPAEK
ncbi:MAG TPA: hypothetical protein VGY31_08250 [Terriglobia bacterium]|nr:hypothetical protein [Terriglobia bacterium]